MGLSVYALSSSSSGMHCAVCVNGVRWPLVSYLYVCLSFSFRLHSSVCVSSGLHCAVCALMLCACLQCPAGGCAFPSVCACISSPFLPRL